jgi:hypothetical protein
MIKMVSSLGLAAADVFYALGIPSLQVAAIRRGRRARRLPRSRPSGPRRTRTSRAIPKKPTSASRKIWNATAEHVKDLKIAPDEATKAVDDAAKRKTNDAVQEVIEFQKHFPEMMAKDQALTQQLAASSKLRAELLAEEAKRGAIGARLIAKQASWSSSVSRKRTRF